MKNSCFLCGKRVSKKNQTYSKEHVFPDWLLEKYNYKRDPKTGKVSGKLRLPNGNFAAYDDIKIPCCKKCNNEVLKTVEEEIKRSVDLGYDKFITLPKITITQWVAKIHWGIRIYDSLRVTGYDEDLKKPLRLLEPNKLGYLLAESSLVRQLIGKTKVHDGCVSLFIFRTFTSDILPFDYLENETGLAIRIGEIGLICSFRDNGLTEETGFGDFFIDKILTPIQFRETAYRVLYFASCIETPYYSMVLPEEEYEEVAAIFENCVELFPKLYTMFNHVKEYNPNRFLEGIKWDSRIPNRNLIFDSFFGFKQCSNLDQNIWRIVNDSDYKKIKPANKIDLFAYLENRSITYHAFLVEEFKLTPLFILLIFDDFDHHVDLENLTSKCVLNGISLFELRAQIYTTN
ncbi:MAG: hypothetical protein ACOX2G_01515 [Bacillota bacterium]